MKGIVSDEIEVKVGAREAWKLYATLQLAKVAEEQLPHLLQKIDVLEGDGAPGTVLKLTFPPGTPVFTSYKEKFTVVDDERMVKETEVIEGGYLDLGFTLYRTRFEVIDNSQGNSSSCITRATIEYDLNEDSAANASFVSIQPVMAIVNTAANYLLKNQNPNPAPTTNI
ncbi:hypothetical protein LguiA_024294 [Lonicera macranthoides]